MLEYYLDHIFDEVDEAIKLDEEQKNVVITDGDLLVIAGAGSGKTTTMVAKVKYLVEVKKINPKRILVISYTNKATEELIERIKKQFGIPIDILTFHKLGLKLLKNRNNVIIKSDTKKILENLIEEMRKNMMWKYLILVCARKYKENKYYKLVTLSEKFIKNYKMKGLTDIKRMKLKYFWKIYFIELYKRYNQYMKDNNYIDFEDMILEATNEIKNNNQAFPYQYIIVDEYQDISNDRFLLLQAIKEKYKCNLIAVGDDWQSIFGFSGSEITLFTKFKSFFKDATELKITRTYRNSQELIDIAGGFVMKNQFQIKKQLTSFKKLDFPIILVSLKNDNENKLKKIISFVSKLRKNSLVFLLGRYKHDFNINNYSFLKSDGNYIYDEDYPNVKMQFLTIHSAKGLGADEVILLNCNDGIYGFPTNKKTGSILKLVESIDNSYCYAEERRLFYVALTRTKNHVFILYLKNQKSIFVKELKNDYRNKILPFEELYDIKDN